LSSSLFRTGRLSALLLFLAFAVLAHAHPHVFADITVKALFDASGFTGVENRWVYDEMYSAGMMASADQDKDGKISTSEAKILESAILDPIKQQNYFNYVQAGTDFLKVSRIKNFKAELSKGKLVIDFVAELTKPVAADWTMLVVVVADPSNYIQMTTDMENADVQSPESLEVEYFADGLDGLSLFKAFRSEIEGLYLRYKKK